MIYTVTLNPSVDYIVRLDQLELGSLNRMSEDSKFPGGKGINVSRVMKRLGVESKATGFLGGFTGAFIEDFLTTENIHHRFIKVSGDTRINIKLKTDVETEINGLGPSVSDEQLEQFLQQFELMNHDDIVLIAGSIP
ncbi:MAG TPA: PfkB family carbohydrate kinase, partial [Metabacillus sp.]|nr:PfkB family carbohydrate kinase [Metabacillus sp.]